MPPRARLPTSPSGAARPASSRVRPQVKRGRRSGRRRKVAAHSRGASGVTSGGSSSRRKGPGVVGTACAAGALVERLVIDFGERERRIELEGGQALRRIVVDGAGRGTGLRVVERPGERGLIARVCRQTGRNGVTRASAVFAGQGRARDRSRATLASFPGHLRHFSRASDLPLDKNRAFPRETRCPPDGSAALDSDLSDR